MVSDEIFDVRARGLVIFFTSYDYEIRWSSSCSKANGAKAIFFFLYFFFPISVFHISSLCVCIC